MHFRNGFYGGLLVAAIWAVYLIRLWQPQRQVDLHNIHLLQAIEGKDWKAVGGFVDPRYQDRWGDDRPLLLDRLREVFRLLPNATIEPKTKSVRAENGRGYWSAKISIRSSGDFADYVERQVNSLDVPFEFEWQRGTTWPWDWTLVSVRNPALLIPAD